jgi:hypothetical protein
MNANAKKWVKALLSGKYKQARGALHRKSNKGGDSFCCLGVACELAVEANIIKSAKPYGFLYHYEGSGGVLPRKVQRWLGLVYSDGMFDKGMRSLSEINDSGWSFKQIARLIERQPEGLFEGGHRGKKETAKR